ncbi:hypothetical protein Tco_0944544, partial [Tanacetum coccineum]
TEPTTIPKAVQIAGTLTDEAIRNGSQKKNPEKRGNRGEPSKDRNGRDDNRRTRTVNAFATTTNPFRRENMAHDILLRIVEWFLGHGHGNNGNQAHGRAFMLGADEDRQDPNIVTGMDWLSNHKAEIICHEKAKEQKRQELVVVRDFTEVFLDDLLRLPPSREIEFRIELVSGAIPVAKSPYRLAPSKMKELSGQLKELQDKEN